MDDGELVRHFVNRTTTHPPVPSRTLAKRLVVITQLAEELDRTTLDLALRIVPVEWWEARLGATVPSERRNAADTSI